MQHTMAKTIAIFSANYLPNIGGIECYTHNLAKALVDLGHRPIVVTNNVFGLDARETDEDGIEIVRLPCTPHLKGRFPVALSNAESEQLLTWLGEQHVDAVIINARFYPHSLLGLAFAEEQGIRPLVIDHGSAHLTFGSAVLDIPLRAVEHAFTEAVKKHDADFYAVSQASVQWLTHFGIEAQGVLNNSIDAAQYRQSASARNFREEFGIADDNFVVCFTGRYIPEKGVTVLANAAKYLEGTGFEFFLAGDGPLRASLERIGASNLHLLGKTDPADIAALLLQSDAFCLPTRSEGFSTSLLEAAACGLTPVITNVGGVAELIPDARYGVVLEEASAAEIIAALEVLRANPEACKEMGRKIQQRVELECSWQRTAELALAACERASKRAAMADEHNCKHDAASTEGAEASAPAAGTQSAGVPGTLSQSAGMQYDPQILRKLQLTELEILRVIDAFCTKNNIPYFLDSGTVLGAMRHKGFIPWDDDVDLGMLRKDYERFVELAQTGLPEGYSLHTFDNTAGYAGFFAKVYKDGTVFDTEETLEAGCAQGIFVDIFPYDLVSDDEAERKRQLSAGYRWQRISYLYHSGKITVPAKGITRSVLLAGCAVAHELVKRAFERDDLKKHFNEARKPRILPASKYQLLLWPLSKSLDTDTLIPPRYRVFEGVYLPCPAQPELYLQTMYGPSWTELPPEEDRRNHAPVRLLFGDEDEQDAQNAESAECDRTNKEDAQTSEA